MQENFLHFLSPVASRIECNGQHFGFIDNENTIELDLICKTNHIFISYIPISQDRQSIPYTVQINTENTPNTNNEYIKIVPFPNNHYDIIMKPFYYYQMADSTVLFNGNIDKYFISITTNTVTNITIFSGKTIVFNKNTKKIINVKVEKKEETIVITGIINDDNYLMLIVDTNNFNIIYEDIVQSIEDNSTSITSLKNINSIYDYSKVCKFNFSSKQSENYFVYNNRFEEHNIHPFLIPQAMLESIKVEDEHLAKSLLSNKYNTTTIQQLKSYFGDIKEIHFNRHQNNPYKVNYTIKSDKYRNYNFLIDNNIVCDIEEIF